MSYNLSVSQKFIPDRPLLPWRRQLGNFNTKLAIVTKWLFLNRKLAVVNVKNMAQNLAPYAFLGNYMLQTFGTITAFLAMVT